MDLFAETNEWVECTLPPSRTKFASLSGSSDTTDDSEEVALNSSTFNGFEWVNWCKINKVVCRRMGAPLGEL